MNRTQCNTSNDEGMSNRRRMAEDALSRAARVGAALACVLLGALALSGAPAVAATQYPLLGEITGAETPEGQLKAPGSIAINDVSKNVLVKSGEHFDAFGLLGIFETQIIQGGEAIAVNDTSGDIYITGAGAVNIYSASGEYISQFRPSTCDVSPPVPDCFEPRSIAVDQATGHVYVFDRENDVIDVFGATGGSLFQITSAGGQGLGRYVNGMAVDGPTGDLLVTDSFTAGPETVISMVYVFDAATGAYLTTWDGSNTPQGSFHPFNESLAITVNEATGDVYVAPSEPQVGSATSKAFIDQFTSGGAYVGQIRSTPSGPLLPVFALAVDRASGDVYAAVQRCASSQECEFYLGVVDVFAGNGISVPHVALGTPSVESTSAILHGVVNPEETGEAICEFEYGTAIAYGQRASCGGPIPNGDAPVEVEARLSGLLPDTTYHYRLDGKNVADGYTNTGEGSEDVGEFHTQGPGIHEESVSDVAATSATFEAKIDPNGAPTKYYFQYGFSTEYGQDLPALPGGAIGSGTADVEGPGLYVRGLAPSTVYHYRVAAVSEVKPGVFETVDGADRTFVTQSAGGSFALADGRQWELVSPASKLGALIEAPGYGVVQASARGDAIAYRASSPTEGEPSGGFASFETVFSARGAQGWSSQDISEPNTVATRYSAGVGNEFEIFSEDLSHAVVQPHDRAFTPLSPEASESTAYLRTDYLGGNAEGLCGSSCYEPLVTSKPGFANVPSGIIFGEETDGACEVIGYGVCGPQFQGASPDLSHIVLSSSAQLTSTPAPAGGPGLYEWSNGSLELLDVLPKGEEGPAVLAGSGQNAGGDPPAGVRGSVSEDGGRVVLEGGAHGGRGLYMRDTAMPGETVRLDVPRGGSGQSENVSYMDASGDASRIFFLDSGRLMAGSSPSGADLYEYNSNAPVGSRLTDLTSGPNMGRSAYVAMVIGASKDGSYVYFAAGGALAPGASEGECPTDPLQVERREQERESKGEEPKQDCNLYVRHEGVTRLIAELPGEDVYDWSKRLHDDFEKGVYARVSPNGRWLAFLSAAELTGYDTHDAVSGEPDVEVYLYDATSDSVVCASCDPSGARPDGVGIESSSAFGHNDSDIRREWGAASVPSWVGSPEPGAYGGAYMVSQPRYLSDSGRLFFDSTDALVAQDVNGVEDVYEYEPTGAGGCDESGATFAQRSKGCVNLVSAGTSPEPAEFVDASETGGDVFFRTASRLASQDYDAAYDIYDAHECTGAVLCMPVVEQTPPCETESSCRVAPTPQPALYGAPASATFSGTGNVVPNTPVTSPKKVAKKTVKCKKGYVRNRKGKCVKHKSSKRATRARNKRRASR